MARHKLSEKDLTNMVAFCSVDGWVKLNRAGASVRCAVAARSAQRRWARLNPDKAAAGRAKKSAHKLTSLDLGTLTGECPLCGFVGVVPQGRGYMCQGRAAELWSVPQAEPQRRCGRCVKFFLSADGTCSYCDDQWALDLGKAFKAGEDLANLRAMSNEQTDLTSTIDVSRPQQALVPDDSRVDGWRVIGGGVPEGVNPKHYVADWLRDHERELEDH